MMSTYTSLLTLAKGVKKKANNENPFVRNKAMNQNRGKRSRSRSPRPLKKNKPSSIKVPKEEEIYIDWDIPDRQYGDLYCKPCDAHMNSEQMWEAHIQGKRHLRTVKKGETADLKYIYVDEDPIMIKQLEAETRPIVGLQHLVEIQRLEQRPIYQCFLCSGNVPSPELLIDHIVGTKHRLAYLKEHDRERYELIQNSNLKKGHIEPVVEECIEKHERDEGRGKMLVKREKVVSSYEKEKAYNHDYSHSRTPKAKNFKSQPSKAKSFKDNDFDNSESTNKHYRSKDWDCGRSTHSDRSFDGYPDDSGRGKLRDKEFDYYKRSPERLESHSRSAYPGQHSTELQSPDDEDYRRRVGKNRHVDERYGYSRHTPEKDPYVSFGAPSEVEQFHSIPQASGIPYHRPRSALDDTYGDLREILEKKKTSVDPYLKETNISHLLLDNYTLGSNHNQASYFPKSDASGSNFFNSSSNSNASSIPRGKSTSNAIPEIPDCYLEMIESMSPTVFLQLAYFKINRLNINTESELKLLDKLSTRITALSMEIKTNQLPTNLQDQFKETMVKSGLGFSPQFTKDFEQMMEMVGQVKASSNLGGDAHISQPAYSTPTFVSADKASNSSGVQKWNQNNTPHTTNRNSWQHVDRNSPPSANSTQLASSSSPYIPGLTFTDNQSSDTTTSCSSPFEVLSNYTKDLLGGVRSKTDSYRY